MSRTLLTLCLMIAATAPALSQQYRQLTDVPTIYVETENRQPVNSKETYTTCRVVMVDGADTLRLADAQIRGRGNSSWWNSAKKSYRLKLAAKQRLLGPGSANARSWTLLANHGDKTMLRNALTCCLGRFMGLKFCPGARFTDLYLNGVYQGSYQISDQVQVHSRRVDIDDEEGWLLEVANENSRETPYVVTTTISSWYAQLTYNIKNPSDEHCSGAVRQDIWQWLSGFEQAVMGPRFADPLQGYRAWVDEEDLVDWYVGAELTGNIDALYSIYMYKDVGEQKMHFGPLWDLDLGYDNSSERSLLRQMEAFLGMWNRPFEQIVGRMWDDPWFARACADRLDELVASGLQQYLLDRIDSLAAAIDQSQQQNFRKWNIRQQVYSFEKHVYHSTYQEYVADLKSFVRIHIPYLQQAFAQRCRLAGVEMPATEQPAGHGRRYDLGGRAVRPSEQGRRGSIYIMNNRKIRQ